ncbi:MAG: hypothetical protein J5W83_06160 [Candidatus Accumulibacter sp.]|uniref:hypothetical protein n=1 Tax=Accumulibacter sp. TaxID=2053492 RepID=UPI001B069082|nr:hypothetical protein [Accumulibacter sp.]MBO3702111.1 hypothetical protein [Accumulibacter sp.]
MHGGERLAQRAQIVIVDSGMIGEVDAELARDTLFAGEMPLQIVEQAVKLVE